MSIRTRDVCPKDARRIAKLTTPYAARRTFLHKELIAYFEDIQEFVVAVNEETNALVGCDALHVIRDDTAEIRTLAVTPEFLHKGIGSAILESSLARAQKLGLQRAFCLTFEAGFFARHGFYEISGTPVGEDAFLEVLHSHDDGVKEFLDLVSYKPSILGDTWMPRNLGSSPLSKVTNAHGTDSAQVPAHSSGA